MTLVQESARVSLASQAGSTACELCTSEATLPNTAVVIQHPRGGVVQLAACDWCVQALRRLSAAAGGSAMFALSEVSVPSARAMAAAPRGPHPAGPPILIMQLAQRIQDAQGVEFAVQVYGRGRTDGTWEGWLEFVGVRTPTVLRTRRETTQSKREDVSYWASGLEPSYVRGAFRRAR
jgi:hypothetical protein